MQEYPATLNMVIDGSTVDLNVDIGGGQIEVQRVRIIGIQTENIMKRYRSSFKGSAGMVSMIIVREWFLIRSPVLTLKSEIIDICGRILGDIFALGDAVGISEYMKNNYSFAVDWEKPEQEELKEKWFDGELVRVPGGDLLPIFHNWGKNIYTGFRSVNFQGVL